MARGEQKTLVRVTDATPREDEVPATARSRQPSDLAKQRRNIYG
jgi:hypothetical protein